MNRNAVIFDMDGVLVDTEPIYIDINQRLYRELGIDVSPEEQLTFIGTSAARTWGILRERFSLPQPVEELIALEREAEYHELKNRTNLSPIEGITPLINGLKARSVSTALASSSPKKIIELILSKAGLESYFDIVVSGEDLTRGKPAPDIFLIVARKLGKDPQNCIVIEDSPHGITAAKAAGMVCIGYRNPNSGDHNLSQADVIISDFSKKNRERILELVA